MQDSNGNTGQNGHQPVHSAKGQSPARKVPRRWRWTALRLGAATAVLSAALAVLANLSEIAGWFKPDETLQMVEQTRGAIEHTDKKVEELVTLLRNQAAASGLNLNIESEDTIRNAIQAIVASGNAQKQIALERLNEGDVESAAELMSKVAASQATAVTETREAAAESWREAGALYFSLDIEQAITSYRAADELDPGNPDTLEMLGLSLTRAGRFDEAEAALRRSLAASPSPEIQTAATIGLGNIAKHRGDYEVAAAEFTAALELAELHGLRKQNIFALQALAIIQREQGKLEHSDRNLQQALALAEAIDDELLTARLKSSLGVQAAARGEWETARQLVSAAHEIYQAHNDLAGQSNTVGNLGAIALSLGETDQAEILLRESVEIGRRLGWQSSVATDLTNIALIAAQRRDFATATADLDAAEALVREHGLGELQPVITFNRGEMAIQQGDETTACNHWNTALPLLQAMNSVYLPTAEERLKEFSCSQQNPALDPAPDSNADLNTKPNLDKARTQQPAANQNETEML